MNAEIAFVTGAGSGIGQGIAIGLAEAGADVALFDLASSAGLADTAKAIRDKGRRVIETTGDVSDGDALARAVEATQSALGGLTLAVNAAGIANARPAEEMPLEQWRRVIDVNLTGVFLSCQAEGRAMLAKGRGAIVNIASMSGSICNRGLCRRITTHRRPASFISAKSLAMEWVTRGVRVNAISPGYTLTPMNLRPEVAEQRKIFERETPMARMATVDEMVGPTIFLLSGAASFVTGVDLLVDGGFECW